MRNAAKWGVVLLASLGFLVAGCGSSSCPTHFKTCGNVCVDIYTDPANCGACGTACAGGQVCSAGACGQSCPVGETACGGSCRDLQTDDNNCGACGTACTLGQHCSAGVCGCLPGMACGPTALVYSDVGTFTYPTGAEAIAAVKRLKGSAIGPFASPLSGSGFPAFDAAYDAGGFDVLVWDNVNYFLADDVVYRLGDWVNCGGRLIFNSLEMEYFGPSARLQSLLGVTVANPFCGPAPKQIFSDTSAVNLFSGLATAPSPLTATQPNQWATFCPGYPLSYELTPAPGGSIAGRFTTTGTGPGAVAVTRKGHVIVHGFNPSEYRVTDANTDGVPDIQALYENEIAYLVNQGPPGLTCSAVEPFDLGPWPIAPWTATGTAYGAVNAACAHDGPNGFSDNGGGNGPGLWYYRTDVTVGNPGQKLSMWIQTPSVASNGLYFLGFGSTATGGWSFFANAAANTINFLQNNTWTTYTSVATTALTFATSTWYRMEVEFGAAGAVTGRLYARDGVTVLGTLTATLTGFAPGGIAIQITGQAAPGCADTIKVYQ